MPIAVTTININDTETLNLVCIRGDRFSLKVELFNPSDGSPYDMTNFVSGLMQVRRSATSSVVSAQFSTAGDINTGLITIDPIGSNVVVEKLALDIDIGDYVYDLELAISTGAKQTVTRGRFRVEQDVTRAV